MTYYVFSMLMAYYELDTYYSVWLVICSIAISPHKMALFMVETMEKNKQKHPVAPFSVRAFCTISLSSGPLQVYFVCISCGKKEVVLCSMHKMMWNLAGVFEKKTYFRLCFHPILSENYVKFNIVWNRLCPHNMCHRIKMGKTERGLRGIFIIIFVQQLSKSVRAHLEMVLLFFFLLAVVPYKFFLKMLFSQ